MFYTLIYAGGVSNFVGRCIHRNLAQIKKLSRNITHADLCSENERSSKIILIFLSKND